MTNYEKIKTIIESWHYAVCQDDDWGYIIYSHLRTEWHIRMSPYENRIEDCLDFIGFYSYTQETIDDKNYISIRPLPIKPPVLKEWDMVEILDISKEVENYNAWYNWAKEMVWKWPFEIKSVFDDTSWIYYYVWNKDQSDYWTFPHYCVSKWVWDDIKAEGIIEIWGVKYNKSDFENAVKDLKPINKLRWN